MTREEFATRIHWKKIIWIVGIFVNPLMIVPQWWTIISSGSADGVSIGFLTILVGVQWAFSAQGFFIRDNPVFVSNGLAGLATLITLITAKFFM